MSDSDKSKNKKNEKTSTSFMRRFFSSFKFKISLYLIAFAVIPVLFLSIFSNFYFNKTIINDELDKLQVQSSSMADDLSRFQSFDEIKESETFDSYSQIALINQIRIRILDNSLNVFYDTYNLDAGKTLINKTVLDCINQKGNISVMTDSDKVAENASAIVGNDGNVKGAIIISKNLSDYNASINNAQSYTIMILFSVCVSCGVLAVFFSIKFGNRTKKVQNSLSEIAGGQIDNRLEKGGVTEYDDMSETFNEILDNANEINKSREQFVSNVSHELKTPMTSMKLLADSLLMNPDVPVEMYREFLNDITSEIDRENEIIEDLLSLVRMDKNVVTLNITTVDVNELVSKVLKRLTPIADRKNVEVVFESMRGVEAQIDKTKMTQVITNLVENAIKYNNKNGYVHVSLNADYEYFYLRVEDNGIGIPEEAQKNVFDRFYRVDKARSRETGGTGLGLSIVKSIILMHGGQIKLYSEPETENGGDGTTIFTVRIPLKNKNTGTQTQ